MGRHAAGDCAVDDVRLAYLETPLPLPDGLFALHLLCELITIDHGDWPENEQGDTGS